MSAKSVSLTEVEAKIYGNWFPSEYRKIRLLGKGGCAVVWEGENLHTKEWVAIKQFSKKNSVETAHNEIWI